MSNRPPTYIAVVEDHASVSRSVGRLLRAAGLQPVVYDSAEAFLADTKHPRFSCLVLDVKLGAMSGIDLARRLAAQGNTTPIVFLTAHEDPESLAGAAEVGCAAYVLKTDPDTDVIETIRRVAV